MNKILGGIAAASAATMALLSGSPAASADPIPANCQVVPWGFLGGQQRTMCDGPVRADGSWLRHRIISVPAHNVPLSGTTNCYGTSFVSCTTSTWGGYFQPYTELGNEIYPVTPETVLPDEPGHLG